MYPDWNGIWLGFNLYWGCTSADGFSAPSTSFHVDGDGMTDAIHLVLTGVNEVILIESCDPERLQECSNVVFGGSDEARCAPRDRSKDFWPTAAIMRKLLAKGFRPRLVVLQAGECLVIPHGCPHIFRKMTSAPLQLDDPFHFIRNAHIEEHGKPSRTVLSIACDNCLVPTPEDCKNLEPESLQNLLTKIRSLRQYSKGATILDREDNNCPLNPLRMLELLYTLRILKTKTIQTDLKTHHKLLEMLEVLLLPILEELCSLDKVTKFCSANKISLRVNDWEPSSTGVLCCSNKNCRQVCGIAAARLFKAGEPEVDDDNIPQLCLQCLSRMCSAGELELENEPSVVSVLCLRPFQLSSISDNISNCFKRDLSVQSLSLEQLTQLLIFIQGAPAPVSEGSESEQREQSESDSSSAEADAAVIPVRFYSKRLLTTFCHSNTHPSPFTAGRSIKVVNVIGT